VPLKLHYRRAGRPSYTDPGVVRTKCDDLIRLDVIVTMLNPLVPGHEGQSAHWHNDTATPFFQLFNPLVTVASVDCEPLEMRLC
jgi:hypothetical protein